MEISDDDESRFTYAERWETFTKHLPPGSRSNNLPEIEQIARSYETKYGIKIVINGQTSYGGKRIKGKQENIAESIQSYQNVDTKVPLYIQSYFVRKGYEGHGEESDFSIHSLNGSEFGAYYDHIHDILEKNGLLDEVGRIKKDKGLKDKFNRTYSQFSEKCQRLFEKQIQRKIETLEEEKINCCITEFEIRNEISEIQEGLKENQWVGYVFINDCRKIDVHSEVLLISKGLVIKPINCGAIMSEGPFTRTRLDIGSRHVSGMYSAPILVGRGPQVGMRGRAILGLLYLKELLKKDAEQLRLTVTFPYYHRPCGDDKTRNRIKCDHVFIPPPQVLRYSEHPSFNDLMEAMIKSDEDNVTIAHKSKQYTEKTIISMLNKSLELVKLKGNEKEYQKITESRKKFLKIRGEWLEKYELYKKKPANKIIGGHNQYLIFKSHDFAFVNDLQIENIKKLLNPYLKDMFSSNLFSFSLTRRKHQIARTIHNYITSQKNLKVLELQKYIDERLKDITDTRKTINNKNRIISHNEGSFEGRLREIIQILIGDDMQKTKQHNVHVF